MKLIELLQKELQHPVLGKKNNAASVAAAADRLAYADLRLVRETNEFYFRTYWVLLIAVYLLTIAVALIYRDEMGGLAAVLGAGGVLQSGVILKLSSEWKEKVRIDTVASLAQRLPPDQLQVVLRELLDQMRDAKPTGAADHQATADR